MAQPIRLAEAMASVVGPLTRSGRPSPDSTTASPVPVQALCLQCEGFGYVTRRVPFGHPDFARLIECECGLVHRRRIEQCGAVSNVGPVILGMRFDTWKARTGAKDCHMAALAFAANPSGWLVLMGRPGNGKTHLAAAIYNDLMVRQVPVAFVNWPAFLGYLREAFDPGTRGQRDATFTARFDVVMQAPVLILDDVGAERGTDWTEEQLYKLLDHRTVQGLPTVITSNCRPDELGHERVVSRILNGRIGHIVMNMAADYRRGT